MIQNLKRASRSTTRNIAEGFGRFHIKENMRFCRISRGSLYEIKDDLITWVDEQGASKQLINDGLELVDKAIYSLNGYLKYLSTIKRTKQ